MGSSGAPQVFMIDYLFDVSLTVFSNVVFQLAVAGIVVTIFWRIPWTIKSRIFAGLAFVIMVVIIAAFASPTNTPKNTVHDRKLELDYIEKLQAESVPEIRNLEPETPTTSRDEVKELTEY